jgi:signal-transduction protein with cAMP-binding, CBS, and nucleotidyltransferase domain
MPSVQRPRNLLLQALPAAEFEALRPRLELIELVKDTVLVEAGAALTHVYLPHSGVISMMVRLAEGQTVEVAMVGRDSVRTLKRNQRRRIRVYTEYPCQHNV